MRLTKLLPPPASTSDFNARRRLILQTGLVAFAPLVHAAPLFEEFLPQDPKAYLERIAQEMGLTSGEFGSLAKKIAGGMQPMETKRIIQEKYVELYSICEQRLASAVKVASNMVRMELDEGQVSVIDGVRFSATEIALLLSCRGHGAGA